MSAFEVHTVDSVSAGSTPSLRALEKGMGIGRNLAEAPVPVTRCAPAGHVTLANFAYSVTRAPRDGTFEPQASV